MMKYTFGILMVSFGEPENATPREVIPFLERIFLSNVPLEQFPDEAARRARCRELARKRAPGLIEDYRRIGGSPLNAQSHAEASALESLLTRRGFSARVYVATQFTDPTIASAVSRAKRDGVASLIALPVYPICGFSTTVSSLDAAARAVDRAGWGAPVPEISGWHHDAAYTRLRADDIRDFARREKLDLADPDTLLYFSAHGTPIKYLDMGSRYDGYVAEHCARVASLLGVGNYQVGYQNHSNRGIAWTGPDNATVIPTLAERRVVVVPISFVHEQSETLAELDIDFRTAVEGRGIAYHRVPTPSDRARMAEILADLVEPFLTGRSASARGLFPCRCRPRLGTVCTNGNRAVDCHYARAVARSPAMDG